MGYLLNEEQRGLVAMAHDFCEKELKPFAAQWDREGIFPLETYKKAMEIGYHCLEIPEEFGGSGIDYITVAAVMEEFAKYDLGFATTLMGTTLSLKPVLMHGTPEQKKMYSEIIVGGGLGAFALTEADAGSDAAACRTTAVRDGDEYVINGTKCFITNSSYAEIFVVFASTNREAGVKGLSAFIVERDRAGFSVDKHEDKMGIRSSTTSDVVMEDCEIPASALIGREGDGFKIVMQTLDKGRVCAASSALGVARAALEHSIRYAQERIQKGKPIWKHQIIQAKLADMGMRLEAARQLVWRAAAAFDVDAKDTAKLASMCKCFAGDTAVYVTNEALQIHGGYGYSREYPIEKLYRDAKIFQIFEGTNEIQRTIIARNMIDEQRIAVR